MKKISTAEIVATTQGISSRWRSRLTRMATLPKQASSVAQNMIEPSRPPQYDASL
jgi:hypothetical protein